MSPGTSKLEWQRAMTTLAALVGFVVVVAAVYWARSIFIPVALAVFLTFVLSPVVNRLERWRFARVPAVLATVGLAVVAFGLVGWMVSVQLSKMLRDLPENSKKIAAKVADARRELVGDGGDGLSEAVETIQKALTTDTSVVHAEPVGGLVGGPAAYDIKAGRPRPELPPPVPTLPGPTPVTTVERSGPSWIARVEGVVSPVMEVAGQVGFAFLLSVFMLMKREDLRNRLIRLIGATQITTTTKAVDDASKRISRYLFAQLMINTAFGAIITVALLIIGVDYAILWGFLAAVMRYVPYIGTWIGLIPPVAISLAMSDGWWEPIAVVAVYAGLEIVCNNVIEPWLYGVSMGLSEVAQLVAAAFWTFLWGPIGLVLSGPLTVCLLVLGKYVPKFNFLEVLLGDEPALSAEVRLYQRLAARDQDEAADIAHEAMEAGSTDRVFDEVMIPALSLARRDLEENTLSKDDLKAILEATREITDELLDSRLETAANTVVADTAGPPVRVLALPARDEADRVALEMLRGLLDPSKWEVEVAPVESLSSEVMALAGAVKPAVVVIGSLPPGGLAHTRYLCKRLKRQLPNARLVVGRWGAAADEQENRKQLAEAGADHVTTTLADMTHHLGAWASVLTEQQEPEPVAKSPGREKVGTPAASGSVA